MLNLSRQQAAWLFYTLIAVLVILFLLLIWIFAIAMTPPEVPLAVMYQAQNVLWTNHNLAW